MGSINNVVMSGHIAKDMELKEAKTGSKYLRFSVCVNRYSKGESHPNYFEWVAWGKTAESIVKFFSKGSKISLIGEAVQPAPFVNERGEKRRRDIEFWVVNWDFAGKRTSSDKADWKTEQKQDDFMSMPEDISGELPFA